MPTAPYAKLLVSVNGGANTDGGVEVPSEATIQFEFESVVGWLRARVEIFDYPEGWATPAGWTLDGATGRIYWDWTGVSPPLITLPNSGSLWGVWMPRLLVNEQLDDDENVIGNLLDEDMTAIVMLSPSGLRDSGAREKQHFTTGTTRIKNWLRSYQRNLRAIENPFVRQTSDDVTPVRIRRYPVPTGGVKVLRAVVKVRDDTGAIYGEYEVKAAYNRLAGTLAELYPAVITTVIESDAGLDVTLTLNGDTDVDLNGAGLAVTNLTWEAQEAFF